MRIAVVEPAGGGPPRLAFAQADGTLRLVAPLLEMAGPIDPDLVSAIRDPRNPAWLCRDGIDSLRRLADAARHVTGASLNADGWRFCPPVLMPGKIIAVGRNYLDHVREGQAIWAKRGKTIAIPEFPTAFAKYASSMTGHDTAIVMPAGLNDIDYEVELAVVIGRRALDVAEQDALDYVAGYTICNDVATRGIQRREMEGQIGIVLAKNFPTFAPMGPWLVTPDEVGDPQNLAVRLEVDGDVRQNASTADMIFTVARLITYWSRMGLDPGDILITGTPSGVALAREEPEKWYLRAGQSVTATIERIGTLRNRMKAAASG